MLDTALDVITGPVYKLGDDVNTDTQCSGKYLPGKDEAYESHWSRNDRQPSSARRPQRAAQVRSVDPSRPHRGSAVRWRQPILSLSHGSTVPSTPTSRSQ